MIEISKIDESLEKAADFIARHQNKDGSWKLEQVKHNQPMELHKDIVVSAENVMTLITCNKTKYIENINKAYHFIHEYPLSEADPLSWWAYKLWAYNYSFGGIYKEDIKKYVDFILKKQKKGFWYTYPSTNNLINYFCISALYEHTKQDVLDATRKWLKKHSVKGKGWGKDEESSEVIESFTSLGVLTMIKCGESPNSKHLQEAKKFLESKQNSDGTWNSSRYTTKKPTSYSTVIGTLSLMLLSKNPFNKRVERSINALLKWQKRGGWPYLATGPNLYFTTFFAVRTLAFYKYLKEQWNKPEIKLLKLKLTHQEVSTFLFLSFEDHLRKKFKDTVIKNILASKILGTTIRAVERRKDILNVLFEKKALSIAQIIDELKKQEKYSYLNKKYHITQVKSDMEFLRGLNMVSKITDLYYVTFNLF